MGATERSQIEEKYKWELEILYSSNEEWEKEFERAKELIESLESKDSIESFEDFQDVMKLRDDLKRKVQNIITYAKLKRDEDLRKDEGQEFYSKAKSLKSEANAASSFIRPNLADLPQRKLDNWKDKTSKYENFLERILKDKDYILSKESEKLLSNLSEPLGASEEIYSNFTNADLTFPEVETPEGEKKDLTLGNFGKLIKKDDREFRNEVYEKFYHRLEEFENTLTTSLRNSVKKAVRKAEIRGYESSRKAALHPEIPLNVYDQMLDSVNSNLGVLHDHLELKKEVLGLDDLKMHDVYMPIAETENPEVKFEEAKEYILEALKPMGEEYVEKVREGFDKWIDVYENNGKRSGAYSSASYDSPPYILMNYQDDISSVYTLAHEIGHSMHAYYSSKNQHFIDWRYGIFLAEIASTLNEALLTHYLLENTEDENFRKHILSHSLEGFRTTMYRQTMFADFEREIHSLVEKGEPLTTERITEVYAEKKNRLYKPVEKDDLIEKEWMKIPHFYWSFYVYQYATGKSIAIQLADRILNDPDEAERVREEFLKKGSSRFPLEILETLDIDIKSGEPMRKAVEKYRGRVRQAEKEL